MKKVYYIAVLALVAVIILVSYFCFWFKSNMKPVSTSDEKISFIVVKGKSASQIGEELYKKHLIRNSMIFKLYVQFFDKSKSINAGEFELSPSMSVSEIVSALGKGPKELWVTIPEGLRKEEVVEKIITSLEMEGDREDVFREEFLSLAKDSEGYLFPDTYLFPRNVQAKTVYDRLKSIFNQKYDGEVVLPKDNNHTKSEIVIMASILERETKAASEKPVVAGILWKRVENGWPLQVDASVQYAVANLGKSDNWWPILTLDDLNINSSYNTYKFKGLPPAPICNPGIVSLKAAANPQDSEFWFYIHSPDGRIHYAKTSEEHSSNVRKYLGGS